MIAALVAFETKEIDARVTAGKLTAAQATAAKANLTAMVTDKVNSVKGFGKKGHGKGFGKGGAGAGGLVVPGTGTTTTAKYNSGLTIKA